MNKKVLSALKFGVAAAAMAVGLGAGSITSEAAFDAPYYNININGGAFDGNHYVLDNGTVVTNSFFCDGTYTYFLQADGTPMKDRLTYHPDGVQVIYFDAQGHECFDTFANVKMTIEGNAVDDLCYFGSTGNLYVNVITYNLEGTKIYYANPYGVMERNGVFQLDTNAVNYSALANGCYFGYANSDGSVKGFYATYEEAAGLPASGNSQDTEEVVNAYWEYFGEISYDAAGNQVSRSYNDGNVYYRYETENGQEYLSSQYTDYVDANGKYCGYLDKEYDLKQDGTTYLYSETERTYYPGQDETYWSKRYDEAGNIVGSTVEYYKGSDIQKSESFNVWSNGEGKSNNVTVYNYSNGKLVSDVQDYTSTYGSGETYHDRTIREYDANEKPAKATRYSYNDGVERVSGYNEYIYNVINNKQVLARMNGYSLDSNGNFVLSSYEIYGYDEYGNCISEEDYYISNYYSGDAEERLSWAMEAEYINRHNYWYQRKYLSYYGRDGVKCPNYGYERIFDGNGNMVKYIRYEGDENNQWKVERYTIFNQVSLPVSGEENQIVTVEYSRDYDSNDVCTGYTVEYYRYVIER